MDDPGPTTTANAICWLLLAVVAVFTFILKLGEAAISEVNEKKARESAEDDNAKAKRLARLLDKKTALLDTVSVCTAFCLAAFSAVSVYLLGDGVYRFSEALPVPFMRTAAAVLVPTALSALIFAAMCILLPSKIGKQRAERLAYSLAGFMAFIKAVFLPLKWLVSIISGLFVLIIGGDPNYEETPVTEDEILSIVDQGEETGLIEESQKEMINNIFEFDDLTAGDVMTHRTDVEAVEINCDMSEAVDRAIKEGYSRMPVYENDLDNIKGILYVKDLLKYVSSQMPESLKPADIMREAYFIPESKKCRDLFSEMTEKHLQMVIVSDEYGGVAGIVTVEDLIESIMGNIQDEFDDEEEDFEQISENIFNIEGTSDIKEVEELLGIEFPEGEYDTIAGYIMSVIGRIPDPEEHPIVEYEGFGFMVSEMEDRRITRVIAERLPEPEEPEEEPAKDKKDKDKDKVKDKDRDQTLR